MPHMFINGWSGSGKTQFAIQQMNFLKRFGYKSLVLDPQSNPDYMADHLCYSLDEMLEVAQHPDSKKLILLVDEMGSSIGKYNVPAHWLVTQSRHKGHFFIGITQDPTQVDPILRGNCEFLVTFKTGKRVAKIFMDDFGYDELKDVTNLRKYEFIKFGAYCDPVRGKLKIK